MGADGTLSVVHVVCSDAFAGVEHYLYYTAPALQRLGHRVTVIGGDPERMRAPLRAAGVRFVEGGRPAATLGALARLARQRPLPDVVHAHMTEAELVAVMAKPLYRRPVVATLHFAHPRGSSGWRRLLWRALPRLLDGQFAVSQTVARARGQRSVVIPLGVPVPETDGLLGPGAGARGLPTGPPSDRSREPVVLVTQRFSPEKRTADALSIWAASGLGRCGWRLELAGTGAELPALEQQAVRLSIESSVRFVGFVDNLPARMAQASVLLSTTPNEGLGMAVIEAMASGLPVVAVGAAGTLESIGPVDGARLFAPGDITGAAASLRALAFDEPDRHAYGRRLLERHRAEYTVDLHAQRLVAAYHAVLGGSVPPRAPARRLGSVIGRHDD